MFLKLTTKRLGTSKSKYFKLSLYISFCFGILKSPSLLKNHLISGRPCRISGSWVTSQGGVNLKLKVANKAISVIIEKLEPPPNHEGILNPSWNLSGQTPFRHGGPFSLIGVNNKTKSLAVFVGAFL